MIISNIPDKSDSMIALLQNCEVSAYTTTHIQTLISAILRGLIDEGMHQLKISDAAVHSNLPDTDASLSLYDFLEKESGVCIHIFAQKPHCHDIKIIFEDGWEYIRDKLAKYISRVFYENKIGLGGLAANKAVVFREYSNTLADVFKNDLLTLCCCPSAQNYWMPKKCSVTMYSGKLLFHFIQGDIQIIPAPTPNRNSYLIIPTPGSDSDMVDVCRSSACIDMMCSNLFLSEIDKNLLTLAGITDILSFQRIEDYLKQLPKDKVRVWNMDNDTYLNLED